jgi:Tol biopolymer transport system component
MGWTPDGSGVVVGTEIDGTRMLMSVPAQGGVLRELYRQPAEEWVYGPSVMDGRYVLYGVEDDSDGALVLKIVDIQTGSVREITRTPWSSYTAYHASQSGDRFLYAERNEGRFEFRAVHPEGESVLLRTFPDTAFPPIIGVGGERIAWWTASEGRSTLYVARSGAGEAREVLTLPGTIGQRGSSPPTWSPDGRFLVTGHYPDETEDALIVEIDERGDAVGDPRVVEDLPESWWNPGWLPDGSGFLVVGGDVWLAPVDGSPTVNLTEDEPGMIWTYALSPDGRHLAVAPEVRRGASIWRIDLEGVLRQGSPEEQGGGGGS